MKQFLAILSLFISSICISQGIQPYKGKIYIFDSYEQARECDVMGGHPGTETIMLKGTLFTVEKVPDATHLVIKFRDFKKKANVQTYNIKAAPSGSKTDIFFLLTKTTFESSCSEYKFEQKWDINFGALTTPFKFRNNPFLFTSNLNLGTSVSYQRKMSTNWSWGIVGGLSLSNVSLDSFSTKGIVTTGTERPAVTPSFHGMIGYKNINFTVGIGWDFINKPSIIEQSWVYHGKKWVGVGIGVSLFNSNNSSQTEKAKDQR